MQYKSVTWNQNKNDDCEREDDNDNYADKYFPAQFFTPNDQLIFNKRLSF